MPEPSRGPPWASAPHAWAWGDLQRIWVHVGTKEVLRWVLPKSKKTQKLKTHRTSIQSFVILGSLLQWRWQWASIGHFVFLFSSDLHYRHLSHLPKCQFEARKIHYVIYFWKGNRTRTSKTMFPSEQEHKVSFRCSLPSPLQKRSKDYKGLHWCQNPYEPMFFEDLLRLPAGLHAQNNRTIQCEHFQPFQKPLREKFLVLGSLLHWRWQWASKGHFVFLFFSSKFHS